LKILLHALPFLLLVKAAPVEAQDRRVVVVGADAALAHALEVALGSWSLEFVTVDEAPPGTAMPAAAVVAREQARVHGAGGVVWIAGTEGALAVWVYDLQNDRTLSRPLDASPPFDPATAASLALSIKTLLRASAVAPPAERYGARPPPPPSPPSSLVLSLESGLGGRWNVLRGGPADLRLSVGLGAWLTPRLGALVSLQTGPGVSVDGNGLRGRWTETTASLGGRARFALTPALSLSPGLGLSLRAQTLDGALQGIQRRVHVSRLDAAVDAMVALEVALARQTRLAALVGLSLALRTHRFLVAGATAAQTAPATLLLGVRLSTDLVGGS
jgi:hypothetical protein